jgi:hypothetical protein
MVPAALFVARVLLKAVRLHEVCLAKRKLEAAIQASGRHAEMYASCS